MGRGVAARGPIVQLAAVRAMRELLARNLDFRRLFLASVVSLAGDWFSFVAVDRADRPGRRAGVR